MKTFIAICLLPFLASAATSVTPREARHLIAEYDATNVTPRIDAKQPLLESGYTIKTINGESVLGSGDIVIQGGGGVDTNEVVKIASVVATNAALAVEDKYGCAAYRWSSPRDWMLDYTLDTTVESETRGGSRTDGYRVYSNEITRTTYSMRADIIPVPLDRSILYIPDIQEFWCVETNGHVSADGKFIADEDGLYNVKAVDNCGRVRATQIPINSEREYVVSNAEFYASDKTGTVRRAVNNEALQILRDAVLIATNKSTYTKHWYGIWNTYQPKFAKVGTGEKCPFAISPHVVASARHYYGWSTGPYTLEDGNGNTGTVNRLTWYPLRNWALQHGWTAAQLDKMGIADIALCNCEGEGLPDGCIPYLFNAHQRDAWFGPDRNAVMVWQFPQIHAYADPYVVTKDDGEVYYSNAYAYRRSCRRDVQERLDEMGQQYELYPGDSGRPIFFLRNGKPVIWTASHTVSSGADFCKSFDVIRAFVKYYHPDEDVKFFADDFE